MLPIEPAQRRQATRLKGGWCVKSSWPVGPPLSFVLDLQAVRTDVDLQALRFLLGLVEIVAEHPHCDDQRADDEVEHIAVAGHPCLHGPRNLASRISQCIGAGAILKATTENCNGNERYRH